MIYALRKKTGLYLRKSSAYIIGLWCARLMRSRSYALQERSSGKAGYVDVELMAAGLTMEIMFWRMS